MIKNELEKLAKNTFTLKVVINRRGKLLVIEEFPHYEIHASLNKLISELEDCKYDVKPGTYYIKCILETINASSSVCDPDYYDKLKIVEFIKV
jgi:hypothetical protein